jgi:hypothetical protein
VYSKLSADVSRLGRGPCHDVLVQVHGGARCIDIFDIILVRSTARFSSGTHEMNA